MNSGVVGAIGRRLIQVIPVIILATITVFGLLQLVPGDPALTLAGEYATEQRVAEIRQLYGLDRPLIEQYLTWLWNAAQGDLSRSLLSRVPVLEEILYRAPNTFVIVFGAVLISIIVGVPLGIWSATRSGQFTDTVITTTSSVGIALPNFWLGMILVSYFSLQMGWLPASGSAPSGSGLGEIFRYAALPAAALAAGGIAEVTRQTRSALIEVLNSQYVRTLRAKGLSPRALLLKHGLRNIGVTLLTVLGLLINRTLGATVVIEAVFAIPGLGNLVVQSAITKDFPVVQGVVLVLVLVVIAVNLIVDVLYSVVDPRISR
jgi:peptide/nickel transport system permease protein